VTAGGNVTGTGGATLTARGTCYGVAPAPTTNCTAEGGTGTGAFTQLRTSLEPDTLYYFRAYGTNIHGTGYSNDIATTTLAIQVPHLTSAVNQIFSSGQAPVPISTVTVVDPSGEITSANDIRVAIATSSVDMRFDTTDTTATLGGTASGKVSNPVSYEGNGSVLVVPVSGNLGAGETVTISGLSFAQFGEASVATSALSLRIQGANSNEVSARDTKTVTVKGALAYGLHLQGQVRDQFRDSQITNAPLFRFRLAPFGDDIDVGPVTFDLVDVVGIFQGEITNATLYRDVNGNGGPDQGDLAVGGAGIVTVNGKSGTIVFETPFTAPTASDYILVASVTNLSGSDRMVVVLNPTNLTATGAVTGAVTKTGGALKALHSRVRIGSTKDFNTSTELGESSGTTNTDTSTGGTSGDGGGVIDPNSGDTIGTEIGFYPPTANGSPNGGWTNGTNAYGSDGSYAVADSNGVRQTYGNFGFSVPSTNIITGIEVKLEASAPVAAGTIGVRLSWNGGQSFTVVKTTGTMSQTDQVYRVGFSSDTWGRTWTPAEFANGNFQVDIVANTEGNTIGVDAIQTKVYHQSSGGNKKGGGAVFAEPNTFFANVYSAMSTAVTSFLDTLFGWTMGR
jgi:hypothetical protein